MNLKNVNLFIGKNGAGKSHLLREIYKVNQLTSKHIYAYGQYIPYITDALRLVDRNIYGVTVKQTPTRTKLIPYSKEDEPIVLNDGAKHILKMFNNLLTSNLDSMYIDGIEKDLHHTVFVGLWKVLFTLAHQLDTRIYVTTHSIDCINAFIKVKLSQDHISSCLVRVDSGTTGGVYKEFNNETLRAAVELNGDLR